jgi:hypothetical protein
MEVLEGFDLKQSDRSAGLLCGVDPHTVARYVNARRHAGGSATCR